MTKFMKQAAKESKTGVRYVVYVPDQGYDVFGAEQMKVYGALVFIEATFLDGQMIASNEVTA
jgi:hypothetical protein